MPSLLSTKEINQNKKILKVSYSPERDPVVTAITMDLGNCLPWFL